jgi:DNA-binding transcriptional LysR family regulator
MVAVPARHPLLAYKRIPLEEVLRYPLVLCDPKCLRRPCPPSIGCCVKQDRSRWFSTSLRAM